MLGEESKRLKVPVALGLIPWIQTPEFLFPLCFISFLLKFACP